MNWNSKKRYKFVTNLKHAINDLLQFAWFGFAKLNVIIIEARKTVINCH